MPATATYVPALGRWLSPDPLQIHGLGSDSNPYAYVLGSPFRFIDPDGLDTSGCDNLSPGCQGGGGGIDVGGLIGAIGAFFGGHGGGGGSRRGGSGSYTPMPSAPAPRPVEFEPAVSDPAVLRRVEVMGRIELGDVAQFGKGLYDGSFGLIGRRFDIDPHYDGAHEVGRQLGQNLALDGVGRVAFGAVSRIAGAFSMESLSAGLRTLAADTRGALRIGGSAAERGAARGIRVTEKGMQLLEANLARPEFEAFAGNDAMLVRLRSAMSAGERVTGADANFYLHEISEGTFRAQGIGYDAAHAAALQKYGVSPYSVYHPDVIQTMPSQFGNAWRAFWGL